MGHWARVCRSNRSVNEVTETEKTEQTSHFLSSVCDANETSEQWTMQLQVDSTPIEFKIDTGADVTIINEDTFHILTPERTLAPPDISLDSPGGELLCLGRFNATVIHKRKDYPFTVRGQSQQPTQPDSISEDEPGEASGWMDFPMQQNVKEELKKMENNGITERVTQPTEWCAPMVPVLKKNMAKARICVDLTKLNKSVKREHYILLTSDEITTKLSAATVFSSLDASSLDASPLDDPAAPTIHYQNSGYSET